MQPYKSEKVWEVLRYVSRINCINYNAKKHLLDADDFMGDMVQLNWWGKFDNLKMNDILFNEVVEWCKENCEGLVNGNPFSGTFEFELETDAMAFVLRWL